MTLMEEFCVTHRMIRLVDYVSEEEFPITSPDSQPQIITMNWSSVFKTVHMIIHAHAVAVLGIIGIERDETACRFDGDDGVVSEVGVHNDPPVFLAVG